MKLSSSLLCTNLRRRFWCCSRFCSTASLYNVSRNETFKQLDERDISTFEKIIGPTSVLTSDLDTFNEDWMGIYRGKSRIVLKPKTSAQVSEIMKYCFKHHLAVVPQGGNTSLVGGSIPIFDEIILNTSALNQINSFDDNSGALVCEAGCILENLEAHVNDHGYTVPLDLGSKGSCQIGGNVSTGAGGIHVIRYGNLHASLLGLEVVLANGEIVDCLSTLKKDNTGYHLPHLFIGAEGTLGIVTRVAISCPAKPTASMVAFLGVESFDQCLNVLRAARSSLVDTLSAFEFLDQECMLALEENLGSKCLLSSYYPFYLVVEAAGGDLERVREGLEGFLETCLSKGFIKDGIVSADEKQSKKIWSFREPLAEAIRRDGYTYKHDLSYSSTEQYKVVEVARERFANEPAVTRIVGYGHLGDGNMHLNLTSKKFNQHIYDKLHPWLYEWTADMKGSISAEHGIGLAKKNYLYLNKQKGAIELMKIVKKTFDPTGILNPYKLLDL